MRPVVVPILFALFALPGSAVAQGTASGRATQASGVTVKGWRGRLDKRSEPRSPKPPEGTFRDVDGDFQVTAGGPAIYWSPAHTGAGAYRVSARFTQAGGPTSSEYYGLFIGGSRLESSGQNYLYCAIAASGTFVVRHKIGEEVHELAGRTVSRAIRQTDGAGNVVNLLAWRVTPKRTSCLVNGVEVWGYASASLVGEGKLESLGGIAGIRVNDRVDVRVSGFAVVGEAM